MPDAMGGVFTLTHEPARSDLEELYAAVPRLKRRRNNPRLHGRHQDQVGPAGMTSASPDGTESFSPWATIARVSETDDAFLLLAVTGRRGRRC